MIVMAAGVPAILFILCLGDAVFTAEIREEIFFLRLFGRDFGIGIVGDRILRVVEGLFLPQD